MSRHSAASAPAVAQTTLGALLDTACARLKNARLAYGHGTTNARDEAAWLLLHALKLPLDTLTPYLGRAVTAAERRRVLQLVEKRIRRRVPAAYLLHEAWLGDHRFYVDERVIVPRSFIAELLRERLSPWLVRPHRVRNVLDLCTGSGCLAVIAAEAFPKAHVDAVDISRDALAVARRNVAAYRLRSRVRLLHSDMFSAVANQRYDLIIANPPYVPAAALRALPREYRHEPKLALAGGKDGLDFVRVLLQQAAHYLTPNGLLVVEVGHRRKQVEAAFPDLPFVWPLTSGGDDCVFILERRDLPVGPSYRAMPAGVRSRRPQARGSGRA